MAKQKKNKKQTNKKNTEMVSAKTSIKEPESINHKENIKVKICSSKHTEK